VSTRAGDATPAQRAVGQGIDPGPLGTLATLRRGFGQTPQLRRGLAGTIALALVATCGRLVVPVAIQRTLDGGLLAPGGPNLAVVWRFLAVATLATLATGVAASLMNRRLFTATETALASLRVAVFRHVHDLSVLTQDAERRGSLVSRVTTDVDTISTFVQWGGINLLISLAQLGVATVLMLVYSPALTAWVWLAFAPLLVAMNHLQRGVSTAYDLVRVRSAEFLGSVAEAVVGAATIRAYGAQRRTQARMDAAIEGRRLADTAAQRRIALVFSAGELASGLATAGVVVGGVLLGVGGHLSVGRLLAFLFLVQLFVAPVQLGSEVLSEAQNAVAGFRRVLGVLDTPADLPDPGEAGVDLPTGAATVALQGVGFTYPTGPAVLHDVSVTIAAGSRVAVVGATGSGKTTVAKLLTRLMDPSTGVVRVHDVDLRRVRTASLRARVAMVPQDGYLFAGTVADNLRAGRNLDEAALWRAAAGLGLDGWLAGLPRGLATLVGERGEGLSAGERQLVALVRASLSDPDLLVLDEATSAVDPATEVRLQRALEGLARGRTTVQIAHRLATAQAADEVLVMEGGRLVERGSHDQLVAAGGVYAGLFAAWNARHGASA